MVSTIDIDKCEIKVRIPIEIVAKLHQVAERSMQPNRNPPIIGRKLRKKEVPASIAYLLTQYAQEKVKDEVLNSKWEKWVSERIAHNKEVRATFKTTYRQMIADGTFKRYPRKGSKKWLALHDEKNAQSDTNG